MSNSIPKIWKTQIKWIVSQEKYDINSDSNRNKKPE